MYTLSGSAVEAIITPPVGVEMLEPRGIPTTGIHDDLYVRVLALGDGKSRLAIVTLDLLGLDDDLLRQVRHAVFTCTGLPFQQLMLNTSHTHSAPVTLACCPGTQEKRNRAWERRMISTTADAVQQALNQLTPVALTAGRAAVALGINRRVSTLSRTRLEDNPYGPTVPWVDVLAVQDAHTDKPLAVLFSHAAHPVTVHESSTVFTADYPGAAVSTLRQQLGDKVIALFAQGCAGDVNVRAWKGGFPAVKQLGGQLADAVMQAVNTAQPLDAGELRSLHREVYLPFDSVPAAAVDALVARVEESYAALQMMETDKRTLDDEQALLHWARRMRDLAHNREYAPGLLFQVQGFAFGDWALLGLTHEPFAGYQLLLDAQSPFTHTMILGYTNGCSAYIPTAEAFYLGGYEVHGGPKLYGLPPLRPECEYIIRAVCQDVLAALQFYPKLGR
jgi:neutral ceramidase